MSSAPAEKEKTIETAAAASSAATESKYDHLSAPASALASGTATPAEKKDENSAPSDDKGKYDHLSVPASAIQSGTATPAEAVAVGGKDKDEPKADTHQGSDMVEAPAEEVKKVEDKTTFSEKPTSEEDVGSVAKGVEGMQVGEGKTVGEQEAKKGEDAVKSVED